MDDRQKAELADRIANWLSHPRYGVPNKSQAMDLLAHVLLWVYHPEAMHLEPPLWPDSLADIFVRWLKGAALAEEEATELLSKVLNKAFPVLPEVFPGVREIPLGTSAEQVIAELEKSSVPEPELPDSDLESEGAGPQKNWDDWTHEDPEDWGDDLDD